MAWIYLCIAGLFEIAWAIGLKHSYGLTRLIPSVLTLTAMALSIFFLSLAVRTLPIGTAYAIWTGIGAVGVALCGIFFFEEPATPARILSLACIFTGIISLKLTSPL